MVIFTKMLSLQLTLFVLILMGLIVTKAGIISTSGRKSLSDLLLNLILPCNILNSFLGISTIAPDFLQVCLMLIIICTLIELAALFGSRLLFRNFPRGQKSVLTYGMVCSNSTFIGYPIAETMLGDIGVMYTAVFQIPLRIVMWTAGVALFTQEKSSHALRRVLLHPCILSVFAGLLLMILPIPLPGFLTSGISAISSCTTAISMFVIGSILAGTSAKSLLSGRVLYYTFLRLIFFPAVVYLCLLPFGLSTPVVVISVLMSAMPAGSTASILADKYGGDADFASQLTFTSTLCSMITIPLFTLLL